jgi:hypothetical protein
VHAAGNDIGTHGARALAASLEKNTTLKTLILESARLYSRSGWEGGMWQGPTAGGRERAHDAERARASSWAARVRRRVPLAGAWLLLVGVTVAVWVGWCARRRQYDRRRLLKSAGCLSRRSYSQPRRRRDSSGGLPREEHDARDARPRKYVALCWGCGGGMWRGPTGRRQRAGCRTSSCVQLGGARAASGPLAGRVAPPLVGVTLAVWVECCARLRQ